MNAECAHGHTFTTQTLGRCPITGCGTTTVWPVADTDPGPIERRLWRIDLNDIRVRVQGEGGRNLEVVQAAGELDGPLTVTVALPQTPGEEMSA